MKTFFLFLFTFVATTFLHAQSVTTLHIDPDNAFGGTTSQVLDSVRFIPLETTNESLFGSIRQMAVTNKYFIIFDVDTRSILLFYRNGKFHTKIRQRSETEYFGRFTVNRQANEIIIWVGKNKLLIYDFDGRFISEQQTPLNAEDLHYFNAQTIAYNIARPQKLEKDNGQKYDLVYSSGFNHITKELLPYNPRYEQYEYNTPMSTMFNDGGNDDTCFFSFPYNYTISQLNDKGIFHQYNLIFPQKYSLPPNFATDIAFAGKRKDYVFSSQENNEKFILFSPFFKENDWLVFHIEKVGNQVTYHDDLAYNLKTSSLYSLDRVTGDSSSYFIPVLDANYAEELVGEYNGRLYTTIPTFILFNIKEASKNKNIKYSPELEILFSKGTKKDNPVIIESSIKSGL